jgi:anti-sigma factor RsiW
MMHDCEDGNMRDLLPGYVHGTLPAEERASVAAHLETCDDCAAELELIETAARAIRAPKVDIGRIVKALPAAPRRTNRSPMVRQLLQLAAAIAIVAIGAFSVITARAIFSNGAKQTAAVPKPLSSAALAAAEAPPKAAVVDSPVRVSSPVVTSKPRDGISFGGGISDLSDDQLNTLLNELDGMQALPSAEPEAHLTPIVPMAGGDPNAN